MPYREFAWRCWRSSCKKGWSVFGVSRGWRHILLAVIGLVVYIGGGVKLAQSKGIVVTTLALLIIPVVILLLACIWNLPKASYEVYKEMEAQKNLELDAKQNAINSVTAEVVQARARIAALETERNAKPTLEISLSSPEHVLRSPGTQGQVLVFVKNASKTATVNNVELDVISVTPYEAPHVRFPARVSLQSRRREDMIFSAQRLTATECSSFAVINSWSNNTFALNTEYGDNNSVPIDVAKFGKVSIQLRAKADHLSPSCVVLTMTGDLKEMNFSINQIPCPE